MISAPQHVWRTAGCPAHKYGEEEHSGVSPNCATCAVGIESGVPASQINNKTFANHAEFFKFGTHVCSACAWLYGVGKGNPGNVIAIGEEYLRPVISPDSATEERPTWFGLLQRIAEMDRETPVAGVLTTDVKPRLWPRMRLASVGSFGLYVHCPDYDVSEYRNLDMALLLQATEPVREALGRGWSKTRIHHGLLSDYTKAKKDLEGVMRLEGHLQDIREWPEFVPALIVSYVRKDEKHGKYGTDGNADSRREAGGDAGQDGDRLF